MFGNRSKKNGKKNKPNIPEVLQVKSVKLETNRPNKSDAKANAKSEDNLRQTRKAGVLKKPHDHDDEVAAGVAELEACMVKKMKTLSLNKTEGENNNAPGTSLLKSEDEAASGADASVNPLEMQPSLQTDQRGDAADDCPLVMEYSPENGADDYAYKYFNKNTKSIKFTNQVTVLYFNGEEILCEAMEPLKKEQEQQIRNKEMRKEHLLSKGQIDNVYLF